MRPAALWLAGAALALVACVPTAPTKPQKKRAGKLSPTHLEAGLQKLLQYPDMDGRAVGPDSGAKVTAVVVFASWCRYCRREIAVLRELSSADPRLRIIGVNYYERDDGARLRTYLDQQAPWLRVVRADKALFQAFGRPSHVPSLYLYDRHGRLVSAYVPPRRQPPTMDELRARVGQLMTGP